MKHHFHDDLGACHSWSHEHGTILTDRRFRWERRCR